ncbi:MAG: DEAD/DEAH box helicase family protein [Planctomycetes bacterium]|nr:DEAD/DEAH box helicase family protein [Planctomycetota bacterium]
MDSFRDIKFPVAYIDKSLHELTKEYYANVVPLSKSVSILNIGINAINIVNAAVGLYYLADDVVVNLILADPLEQIAQTTPGVLEWNTATQERLLFKIVQELKESISTNQAEYIGLLAWFIKNGNLRIHLLPLHEVLDTSEYRLSNDCSIIKIFRDSHDELICMLQEATDSVHVTIKWAWGDPERLVIRLNSALDKAITKRQGNREVAIRLSEHLEGYCPETKPARDPSEVAEVVTKSDIINLWKHQKDAISNWINNDCRGIFEMCTGAGKTISAIYCIKTLEERSRKMGHKMGCVVIACPTKVLVEQWITQLKKYGLGRILEAYESVDNYIEKLTLFLDSTKRKEGLWVVVTTFKTFFERPFASKIKLISTNSEPGLLIADEMHNLGSATSRKRLSEYGGYFKYRIGLSATPEIEGDEAASRELNTHFGGVVLEYGLAEAIRDDILCQYRYYPCPKLIEENLSDEYIKVLDLIEEKSEVDLYRQKRQILLRSKAFLICLDEIIEKILDDIGQVKLTLVFGPPGYDHNINGYVEEQQRLLALAKKVLEDHDLICGAITASTPNSLRPVILKDFENRDYDVLLSIGCLDEGMDIPCVRRAIMLYSHDREKQFIQRRGRVLRKYPNKECAHIYDLILLPGNKKWPKARMEALINKEMRRYRAFAQMAQNSSEAELLLQKGMATAIGGA